MLYKSHQFIRLFAVLQQVEYYGQKLDLGVITFRKTRTIDHWRKLLLFKKEYEVMSNLRTAVRINTSNMTDGKVHELYSTAAQGHGFCNIVVSFGTF